MDSLNGSSLFSTCDLHNIQMQNDDRDKI